MKDSGLKKLLAKAKPASNDICKRFSSPLFKNLLEQFLNELELVLTKRLDREVSLKAEEVGQPLTGTALFMVFQVFQSEVVLALPFEVVQELISNVLPGSSSSEYRIPTAEDQAGLRALVHMILTQDAPFPQHRVMLKSLSIREFEHCLGSGVELPISFQVANTTYPLLAVVSENLFPRLRVYAQLVSGLVLRKQSFNTEWVLNFRYEIDSYQMLFRLRPGAKISLFGSKGKRPEIVQAGEGKCRILPGEMTLTRQLVVNSK